MCCVMFRLDFRTKITLLRHGNYAIRANTNRVNYRQLFKFVTTMIMNITIIIIIVVVVIANEYCNHQACANNNN